MSDSASLSVLVGGTIAIDHVKTPTAEGADLLGGSAAYAALSSSFFCEDVRLVGIIGRDFPAHHLQMLENRGICLNGVEQSEGESFTWSGEYLENLNERVTHRVGLNVLESWEVKIPAEIADSQVVVLANMSPDNQLQMLAQCTHPRRFVVADTMDLWISIANERLHEVLKQLDLFVINESEARDFAGTANLIEAGRLLLGKGPRFVVIKLGEFGAMLFSSEGDETEFPCPKSFFRCAAFPLRGIADPTGAGDSFLGGLAGYLAAHSKGEFTFENLRQAVTQGSVVASFTCEAFSTRRLEEIDSSKVEARLQRFREMTAW
ncbi:sugar/nucleoside kinase (ribokinase family) [Haloferula luteola]|uniref:Sugar/nucleoside kinase (Ribokinase family) n=1 Tax=Haloferula luteola TaxID=595692 RepID=A0A840V2L4_9BACT|nr:PfkB family carbohydrate kinase [Haloferula luteola]MBB5352537.1 sugar/nucleoside kinase (ribokinase family) [Haloferula luteola]